MIRLAVCDENRTIQKEIAKVVSTCCRQEMKTVFYDSLESLIAEIGAGTTCPDLILSDISKDACVSINESKVIRQKCPEIKFIWMSSDKDVPEEIFDTEPVCCLPKPIPSDDLKAALTAALARCRQEEKDTLILKNRNGIQKIPLTDISYLESDKHVIYLHGRNHQWKYYIKLDDIMERLPSYFVRCHQSYALNMTKLRKLSALSAEFTDGRMVPVSRARYKTVKEHLLQYYSR
ncbi:LytTR family DNA-binding domain-containing protein [Diplocloster hominis]|uniref:LytR/AlgR family response regulator transcription factor n=1 Tax=Diplocloster hominis TaxID=3079010 RepID=UPI0031B9B558